MKLKNTYLKLILKDGWYKTATEEEMRAALANFEGEAMTSALNQTYNTMNNIIRSHREKVLDEIYGEGEG